MPIASDSLVHNKPLKMRWVMISFAFFATLLNYIDRLAFNYLSAEGELRKLIPNDKFGYIGSAFFIAYALSNAFSGFFIDRLATRVGYSICMAFWTTASLVQAFAITPLHFAMCRFFLGIGEAGNWPAGLKLTGEWFSVHERSTASGIFNSGSALGSIIVPPLSVYLGVHYGWRATFIILGILGYLWVAAFWFSYYTPEKTTKKEKVKSVPPLRLLKTRFVSMFILAKVFIEPVWYFVTFWIGRYLVDVHHWDLKKIGWFAAIPFIIADVGNIIGGYFTQFIIRLGIPIPRARKTAIAIAGFLMAVSLLSGPFVISSPMTALIVFGITGFGYTMYTANALAIPADVVPKNSAASAWGLACIGNGIGGAIFQSVSGRTLKSFSASHNYTFAYNILFIGFGSLAVIGILIMLFAMGPFVKNKNLAEYEAIPAIVD